MAETCDYVANVNMDIATEIALWLDKSDDDSIHSIVNFGAVCTTFMVALRRLIARAKIASPRMVRMCLTRGVVDRCGNKRPRTNAWCYANHHYDYVDINELQIRCTIGQFVTEIFPHTYARTFYMPALTGFETILASQCCVCGKITKQSSLTRYYRAAMLTIVGETVTVRNMTKCDLCTEHTHSDDIIYLKNIDRPTIDNLKEYKIFKRQYYTHRRKKYNFVFIA